MQVFSSDFCQIFKNTFFYRNLEWLLLKIIIWICKKAFFSEGIKFIFCIYVYVNKE